MSPIVDVGDRPLASANLIDLLAEYQLLPHFLTEVIIDKATKEISLTPEEELSAIEQYYTQQQIGDDEQRHQWLSHYRMSPKQLSRQALRQFKLAKFKYRTWNHLLEADFLKYKPQLDRYVYSLIRVGNAELAQELYFRLKEGENTFAELAPQYSEGPEAKTAGQVGPVAASTLHPALVQMLTGSKPGQLWPPQRLGEWSAIVRLEQCMNAQFNEAVRNQLLERRYQEWLEPQLQSIPLSSISGGIS
jgi:parvulin-like peptidyl-prolyl isomerase